MGTLYDVLQVSPEASPEIIRAAFERLSAAVLGQDADSENKRKALNEAFFTLANPEKRQRYDARLASRIVVQEVEADRSSMTKYLIVGLVACAGIFGFTKYNQTQENARLERERLAAEQRKAELAAQQESEQRQAEHARRRAEQISEQQQRYAIEQARREADAVMYRNQSAEERARRDAERQQQSADRQAQIARQNEQREAQQRVERDRALLRRLEAENSRGKGAYLPR